MPDVMPFRAHRAKNAQGKYNFHPVAINLLVECAKLIFATATLIVNVSAMPAVSIVCAADNAPGRT